MGDAELRAIPYTAEAPIEVSGSWVRELKSIATGVAFTALLAVVGTVLVTFTLLAAWVFAPVLAGVIAFAIHRHGKRRALRAAV
jgi:phosphate/sulfate permease